MFYIESSNLDKEMTLCSQNDPIDSSGCSLSHHFHVVFPVQNMLFYSIGEFIDCCS